MDNLYQRWGEDPKPFKILSKPKETKTEAKKMMENKTAQSLPDSICKVLPEEGQREYKDIVNQKLEYYNGDEQRAQAAAWVEMRKAGWTRDPKGQWSKGAAAGDVFKSRFNISKVNEEKHQVFGWALIAYDEDNLVVPAEFVQEDGQVLDWQKDLVDEEDLEKMAYRFVLYYREGGEMHIKGGSAQLIESVVFTKEKQKALGIPEKTVPVGWWIGFYVTDEDAWEGIKSGKYKAFSIEGTAIREEVKEGNE